VNAAAAGLSMSAQHSADSLAHAAPPPGPLHLAIGMFDGVHLGHQAVIEAAMHSARQSGGASAVLTFHPHPSRLFHPEEPARLLMPPEQKTRFLREFGVDLVIAQPFTRAFARIRAENFLAYLKKHLPSLAAVYVGEDFRFGRGRAGDVGLLVRAGRDAGVAVVSVARLRHNGRPISSTRVRELLATGRVGEAARLLGYTYYCDGVVQSGRRLGRTLGFPTLNLAWAPETRPAYGVYAVRLRALPGGRWRRGVANYGMRPTVARAPATQPLLEVHLLDAVRAPGPRAKLRVEWLEFLRPEKKFPTLEALRRQIARDCAAAKAFFKKRLR
jgi:riboflavin kinase / FMN adenylyltransferase